MCVSHQGLIKLGFCETFASYLLLAPNYRSILHKGCPKRSSRMQMWLCPHMSLPCSTGPHFLWGKDSGPQTWPSLPPPAPSLALPSLLLVPARPCTCQGISQPSQLCLCTCLVLERLSSPGCPSKHLLIFPDSAEQCPLWSLSDRSHPGLIFAAFPLCDCWNCAQTCCHLPSIAIPCIYLFICLGPRID